MSCAARFISKNNAVSLNAPSESVMDDCEYISWWEAWDRMNQTTLAFKPPLVCVCVATFVAQHSCFDVRQTNSSCQATRKKKNQFQMEPPIFHLVVHDLSRVYLCVCACVLMCVAVCVCSVSSLCFLKKKSFIYIYFSLLNAVTKWYFQSNVMMKETEGQLLSEWRERNMTGQNTNLKIFPCMSSHCCVSFSRTCACVMICVHVMCVCIQWCEGRGWCKQQTKPIFSCQTSVDRCWARPQNLSFKHAICRAVSLLFQAPGQLTPCKYSQPTS